ncbi:MAG: serine/threonine protein kinase [Deltaproteobacteria bacterium]|nr:serine/threonine protein kinase [Deltaproteobacteria bacterium]HCH61779.1 formylglycine-generating enzyme family protein [Deltaproteobacteria bacterium]
MMRRLWTGSCALLAVACSPAPEGTAPGECTDRMDNDWDAFFDCADPDCMASPDCQTTATGGDRPSAVLDSGTTDTETLDWSDYPLTFETVSIPAGRFTMGCTEESWTCDEDEFVLIDVTFTVGWEASTVEVTQGLYWQVMGELPSHFEDCGPDCPVEEVDWYNAVAFCNGLSQREGLTPAYTIDGESVTWDVTADGWRLPTEAEWEYMARAGRSGSDLVDGERAEAWYLENSNDSAHPVGSLPANPWGLHDMSGNVTEWVWDWYGPPSIEPVTDPTGPSTGDARINRGGSWSFRPDQLRSSRRMKDAPEYIIDILGMRVVRGAR